MADPLRVAMISYYLPSESKIGVGYQVHELATEMQRQGHDVTVFSASRAVFGARYAHRHVPLSGRLRTFRFATALRRIDFDEFDVLHAHGDDYWMLRRRARAHVRTLHGSCFDEALHIRGGVERLRMVALGFSEVLASLVADVTVVVSPATRRWTPWVQRVIPNGVDTTRFAPDANARSDAPVVLCVGGWGGRKRGALLAGAFVRDVLPAVPDAQLWMVAGDVPDDVHPAVRALGRVDDAELQRLYRTAWLFCLPSTYEGFGIPYVEAMASGLPVVATPNVGARYVTREGADGVLTGDERLGATIAALLIDVERRARLRDAGLRRSEDFALVTVVRSYVGLYRDVIDRRR